jgi:DNA-binding CsgD family transcriptional regulator
MTGFNDELSSLFEQIWIMTSSSEIPKSYNTNLTKDSAVFKSLGLAFVVLNFKTAQFETAGGDTLGLLGLTSQKILSSNASDVFNFLPIEQRKFYLESLKWQKETLENVSNGLKAVKSILNYAITFDTPSGENKRLLIFKEHLEEDANQNPIRILIFFKDIKHLIKNNNFWCRMSFTSATESLISCYHSKLGIIEGDIISKREKDILELIDEGLATKEIAEKLFISPVTVNNHRANMLMRTGAKDTNALVQIGHMCTILG